MGTPRRWPQRRDRQTVNAGVRVKSGTRDEADQRRVVELLQFDDPAGIRTEVYYGPPLNQRPFHPPRAITGFKTGTMGLGHLVVYQPDLDASAKFYTELLGFRVSDVAGPLGRPMAVFLHCNPRHRSIALFCSGPKRINHFMLECNSLDDVGSARDIARQVGRPIVIDLGRHMNDHMVSFYVRTPRSSRSRTGGAAGRSMTRAGRWAVTNRSSRSGVTRNCRSW